MAVVSILDAIGRSYADQGNPISRNQMINLIVSGALKDMVGELVKKQTKRADGKLALGRRRNRAETAKHRSAPKTSRKEEIKEAAELLLAKVKSPKERKIVQEAIENGDAKAVSYYDQDELIAALNSGLDVEQAKTRTSILVPDHLFEKGRQ